MIQRIQSVYLLVTSLLSILFLKGSYLTFFDKSGSSVSLMMSGMFRSAGNSEPEKIGNGLLILILSLLLPVISTSIIFLYKKRYLQILLVKILIVIIMVFIATSVAYSYMIVSEYDASFGSWYKLLVPAIQLILSFLALKGIKKDEDLVKSYDRLR